MYSLNQHQIALAKETVSLLVPAMDEVQAAYAAAKLQDATTPFPYWAKLWPGAVAMCLFLEAYLPLIKDKKVLELAAGLGLPSVWAARYAQNVLCTDYVQAPLQVVQESLLGAGIKNVGCALIDWHQFPAHGFLYEVVLLSDVNYDPKDFEALHQLIVQLIAKNICVVLSTPQRLMAKTFIAPLLGYCKQQNMIEVDGTPITVLVF